MSARSKLVLVPGLLCTRALWEPQIAALSDIADCMVADHTHHKTMDANAKLAEKGLAQDESGGVAAHPAIADALKSVAETNQRLEKILTFFRTTLKGRYLIQV